MIIFSHKRLIKGFICAYCKNRLMALIKKAPNYKFCYDTIDGLKTIQMNYDKIVIYCNELLLLGTKTLHLALGPMCAHRLERFYFVPQKS